MPLSFSSILFSNSVAKCSNLNPDFFSLNSGLISLKLLLSPKINLSCSSVLEAKGKGGDRVRWREGYVGVSIINVQDDTKYDKEGQVKLSESQLPLIWRQVAKELLANVCSVWLLTLDWVTADPMSVRLMIVRRKSRGRREDPGGRVTRTTVRSLLLRPSQDMWPGWVGNFQIITGTIIISEQGSSRQNCSSFKPWIIYIRNYSDSKNICSSRQKYFLCHPACRTAPAPAPASPIFWHLLPRGQGGGSGTRELLDTETMSPMMTRSLGLIFSRGSAGPDNHVNNGPVSVLSCKYFGWLLLMGLIETNPTVLK